MHPDLGLIFHGHCGSATLTLVMRTACCRFGRSCGHCRHRDFDCPGPLESDLGGHLPGRNPLLHHHLGDNSVSVIAIGQALALAETPTAGVGPAQRLRPTVTGRPTPTVTVTADTLPEGLGLSRADSCCPEPRHRRPTRIHSHCFERHRRRYRTARRPQDHQHHRSTPVAAHPDRGGRPLALTPTAAGRCHSVLTATVSTAGSR